MFPYGEVNSINYCDSTLKKVSENRATDCKHMMCINCCNHLLYVMKFVASRSVVSQSLNLNDDAGFNTMKSYITSDMVTSCRKRCAKEYPVEDPIFIPPPPKDPKLGKIETNPGKSCLDIKVNGKDTKDGQYFVAQGSKPAFKVYCDMTSDGGGWTLFFAYSHHPYEDYDLDSTTMPLDPLNSRSHMNLEDAGFDLFDATEIRFMCVTKHKSTEQKFLHFKSRSAGVIKVAMKGDQTQMKVNSWKKEFTELDTPTIEGYSHLMKVKSLPKETNEVNSNPKGGFFDTPFGGFDGSWTVKGDTKFGGKWECGDKLDSETGSKYDTLHQIWFRGKPPSKEFLEARRIKQLNEQKEQKK